MFSLTKSYAISCTEGNVIFVKFFTTSIRLTNFAPQQAFFDDSPAMSKMFFLFSYSNNGKLLLRIYQEELELIHHDVYYCAAG